MLFRSAVMNLWFLAAFALMSATPHVRVGAAVALIASAQVFGGVGESFLGAVRAPLTSDLAPPERRGEAVSYWSVAVYGGLAFGPYLGDLLQTGGHAVRAFVVSAGLATLATVLGTFTRDVPREPLAEAPKRLVHPAALRPGTILFLGLMPLSAFGPLLPLYVDSPGGPEVSAGLVFLVYPLASVLINAFTLNGRDPSIETLTLANFERFFVSASSAA